MELDAEQQKKLRHALTDYSDSLLRVEAEASLQKNIRNDICEELEMNKKVFTKLGKAFHKKTFPEEVQLNQEFESLYEIVDSE